MDEEAVTAVNRRHKIVFGSLFAGVALAGFAVGVGLITDQTGRLVAGTFGRGIAAYFLYVG